MAASGEAGMVRNLSRSRSEVARATYERARRTQSADAGERPRARARSPPRDPDREGGSFFDAGDFESAMKRSDVLRRGTVFHEALLQRISGNAGASASSSSAGLRCSPYAAARRGYGDPRAGQALAYRRAAATAQRIVACASCGLLLFRDIDVLQGSEHAVRLSLDDSDNTLVVRRANIQVADEEFTLNAMKKHQVDEDWAYSVRNAFCARCGLFLGVEVVRTCDPASAMNWRPASASPASASSNNRAEELLWMLFESHARKHALISPPRSGWLRSVQLGNGGEVSFASSSSGALQLSSAGDRLRRQRRSRGSSDGESEDCDEDFGSDLPGSWQRPRSELARFCCGLLQRGGARGHASRPRSAGGEPPPTAGSSLEEEEESGSSGRASPQRGATAGASAPSAAPLREVSFGSSRRSAAGRTAVARAATPAALSAAGGNGVGAVAISAGAAVAAALVTGTPPSAATSAPGTLRSGDGVPVGQFYFGARYLRLLEASGAGTPPAAAVPATPLICAGPGCSNVISYADMILDCNRRWSISGGPSERALYVNTVCDDSFTIRNVKEHRLAQGLFDMADVHCSSCGRQVGYHFVEDKSEGKRNVNQVGRFGLVCSRIRMTRGYDVYVRAGKQRAGVGHPSAWAPCGPGIAFAALAVATPPQRLSAADLEADATMHSL
eukprot:TRINITY_DN4711_c0_g3_i1.p1 TRINITY_DN4711_c0_g3~~TRINITY_DN4711_c0_g3_i1.p1  ORF type:complete len:672 (+),score=139.77 TRINITY_DN4711_c0_g3_i1:111-2126(+)